MRYSLAWVLALLIAAPVNAAEITDAAGRKVVTSGPVTRIAAAGHPSETLVYVFAPEAMVGWTRPLSPDAAPYIPAAYRDKPIVGQITGQGDNPDIAAIIAAKPDLIVDYGTIEPRYGALAQKIQDQTGIPYVLLDGSFDKIPDTFRLLGRISGREARGEELANYTAGLMVAASRAAAAHKEKAPSIYVTRTADGLRSAPSGTLYGGIYDLLGLRNVATALQATAEDVQNRNPDIVLALDPGFVETAKQAPWSNLRAVNGGHVITAPALPRGWTDRPPSVNRVLGMTWLASELYGSPSREDFRAEAKTFFKMFYHLDISDAQLDALLNPAAGIDTGHGNH